MSAVHKVFLKNQAGQVVAVFDSWTSLEYELLLNDVATFSLQLRGDDPRIPLFQIDGQVEVYRKWGPGAAWALQYEGLIVDPERKTSAGIKTFTANANSYLDLLARRIVAYNEGTVRADKEAAAETVIKQYVLENAGIQASGANGRRMYLDDGVVVDFDGITPGLSVETDYRRGTVWSGSKSMEGLLATVQDVAKFAGFDFTIYGSGPAQYTFMVVPSLIGSDRTTLGLDPITHKNAAGNTPIILSPEDGTVAEAGYIEDHRAEANAVLIAGPGEKSTRKLYPVENAGAQRVSPIGRREISRSDSPGSDTVIPDAIEYYLKTAGLTALKELAVKRDFSFTLLQQPAMIYGRDYFFGDRITVRYDETEHHNRIVSVKIKDDAGGEALSLEFANL